MRYNTLINIMGLKEDEPEAVEAKEEFISHPKIRELITGCQRWPEPALKRHNDATHTIHKISFLADWGLTRYDQGVEKIVERISAHQSPPGAFQSKIQIPERYGGDGEPGLGWMLCDAPLLLYSLLSFGWMDDLRIRRAVAHLESLVEDNRWRCVTSVPGFRGPGRRTDHCPYANLISLKALSLAPGFVNTDAAGRGIEAQLGHWEHKEGRKIYLFGIGSTFKKLKYPFIWYDVLHVVDVLSRFPAALRDGRFIEMWNLIRSKQNPDAGFTPESVWRAW
ncbi:MAG: hypothetical protein ACE5OO_02535, partial [Candidatus Bathyarchaeia archaeon]